MKTTSTLNVFVLAVLMLSASAYAQSPRDQLQLLTVQLQKSPTDNALRERILRVAATLKPAPAVPDAAITFEGRAQFAFKGAKSENDFLVAAHEYEKAVAVAPWVQGYYADLCTIYEKAGKLVDAKRHCGFYLIGLTDPVQMTEIKRRIAGLEFGIEKAEKENSPEAQAARERDENMRFIASLEGALYVCNEWLGQFDPAYYQREQLEIKNGKIRGYKVITRLTPRGESIGGSVRIGNHLLWFGEKPLQGKVNILNDGFADVRVEISTDRIVYAYPSKPSWHTDTCRRQ